MLDRICRSIRESSLRSARETQNATYEAEFNIEAAQHELAEIKVDVTTAVTLDVRARAEFEIQSSNFSLSIDTLTRAIVALKTGLLVVVDGRC